LFTFDAMRCGAGGDYPLRSEPTR